MVVVPRERFSHSHRSLETIREHTRPPYRLLMVDAGTPARVRRRLRSLCQEAGFERIETDRYLSPNQARNLALERVDTRYVVFVDNDAIVTPGWLEALVGCAEETGAWVVGPLYCIGAPEEGRIHMAGGEARIEEAAGLRRLHERHCHQNVLLTECPEVLVRRQCELVEFHCMLVRKAVFEKLGRLDEELLSSREHIDLCLQVREAGGSVWFEPASVVTYVPPPPFAASDLPYYLLRWSDGWASATYRHFNEKWRLDEDPSNLLRYWIRRHRRVAFRSLQRTSARVLGAKRGEALADRVAGGVESALIAHAARRARPQP